MSVQLKKALELFCYNVNLLTHDSSICWGCGDHKWLDTNTLKPIRQHREGCLFRIAEDALTELDRERIIQAAITFSEEAKNIGLGSLDRMPSKIIHEVYDSVRVYQERLKNES